MPTVTQITEQRRRANRRNVYLDGAFAFGCNLNVIARFRLRSGLNLTTDEVEQIQKGEVRQECFDAATRFLESRLHSRMELKRKLMRKEIGEQIIEGVLEDLVRLGYLDDAKFAVAKAGSAAKYKHHGPRRAMQELMRAGVKSEVAKKATTEVYNQTDSTEIAMNLAQRQKARLKKLDPAVARRRLTGTLVRRGFDFGIIKTVLHKTLGNHVDETDAASESCD